MGTWRIHSAAFRELAPIPGRAKKTDFSQEACAYDLLPPAPPHFNVVHKLGFPSEIKKTDIFAYPIAGDTANTQH